MAEKRAPYRTGSAAEPEWNDVRLRALRRHLRLTQQELATELGVRQQTVSEWETGVYRPRGASRRLLGMVAEQSGFYEAGGQAAVGSGQ